MTEARNGENNKTLSIGIESAELTELVSRAKAGDEEAYERLMRLYAEPILVYCRTMTHSEQDAQDAAQEVAISVWRSIERLESPYAFTKWLKRLMVFVVSDVYRKNTAALAHRADFDEAEDVPDADIHNLPEQIAVRDEARGELFELIQKLPSSQKNALYFFYYEDMDYKQIAETLDITVGSVSSNLKKAKKNLKKLMEKQAEKTKSILENLSGAAIGPAAMGPAISAAFQGEAQRLAANGLIHQFCAQAAQAPHIASSMTGKAIFHDAVVRHGLSGAAKTGIAVAVSAGVALGGLFIYQSQEEPPDRTISYTASHAVISFVTGDEIGKNVNPVTASITVGDNEGQATGWRIVNASGTKVAQGDGLSLSVPEGLSAGMYTVIWDVANSYGAVSEVSRDFYIQ